MAILINFVAFQIGWFAVVLSAAALKPWIGVLVAAAVIVLHLFSAARRRAEFALLAVCAALGALWDSFLVSAGWVAYPSGMFLAGAAPYWIILMWPLFATTLNVSLGWLKGRPMLAAGFGLLGGPLSYVAGQKLGGIVLVDPVAAVIALGAGWAIMMPSLLAIAERFNGVAPLRNSAFVTE